MSTHHAQSSSVRRLVSIALFGVLTAFGLALLPVSGVSRAAEAIEELRVDYAYYNPSSLVLRKFGWLEKEFASDGIEIHWVLSLGSNRALQFLQSDSVEFGSTAGAAALMARANGLPIEAVYIYSKPEWTALVTTADSDIETVADLRGRTVAATKGTDPYIFLLRALETVDLTRRDVRIVNLQHPDGKQALELGQVDAWAGLDPHMAQTELDSGSHLFYRNPDFNTYGFLNVRAAFAEEHPEIVERVIRVYERARKWILETPDDAVALLAEESNVSIAVAEKELVERTDLSNPVPGAEHVEALEAAAAILIDAGLVRRGADVEGAIRSLVVPDFAEWVIK